MSDVASKMVGQFADCLGKQMAFQRASAEALADGDEATLPPPPPPPPVAKPISGFSILWAAISGALSRLFRRSGG